MSKLFDELWDKPAKGMLVYIPTDRIEPHPDNPRKDLGDLTELADSIRQNGILQNLTVVPQEGDNYRALIGHRRLAAAKLAGLAEVPCVIVEMDYRDQLQTMLQENMQRSDLTVYEQAQGFQMMLDLGETVETLAEKSGFSQSTIRRRVKLLELDEKAFKASVERGATMADYAELEKIENPERKNRVLGFIGTHNFKSVLKQEQTEEQHEKGQAAWKEALSPYATQVNNRWEYQVVKCWSDRASPSEFTPPEDVGEVKYYFAIEYYGGVYLLKDKPAVDKSAVAAADERRQRENERIKKLREAEERAFELRAEFAADVSIATVKAMMEEITTRWIYLAFVGTDDPDVDDVEDEFAPMMKENAAGEMRPDLDDLRQKVSSHPEWALWRMIWLCMGDCKSMSYSDWYGTHDANEMLDGIYDLLTVLGYEMSDEEKQLQDGTHPLYQKEV